MKCTFPGHEVYELVLQLDTILSNMENEMKFADLYMSPINMQYNYMHKKRSQEVKAKLSWIYSSMVQFKDKFIAACDKVFWSDTAIEWLSVYFFPKLDRVQLILETINNGSVTKDWLPRPLPIKLKNYPKYL